MTTTFQYISDLHLECYNDKVNKVKRKFNLKNKASDILLLAGDIGKPTHNTYKEFLKEMSITFEQVIITTGNHEYYNMNMNIDDVDIICRDICRSMPHNNVKFLQNEVYEINNTLTIFGGTFWTKIPLSSRDLISYSVNDYKHISDFTPEKSSILHGIAINALKTALEQSDVNTKWIVMSHHMPSFDLIDAKYKTLQMNKLNYAFASDIPLTHDDRIKAWVYGHTHTPKQINKFYCNPVGYPGENKIFDLTKSFQIS